MALVCMMNINSSSRFFPVMVLWSFSAGFKILLVWYQAVSEKCSLFCVCLVLRYIALSILLRVLTFQ